MHGPDHHHLYAGFYSDDDLAWWTDRIQEWHTASTDVFVYFNNDGNAYAVRNARDTPDPPARLGEFNAELERDRANPGGHPPGEEPFAPAGPELGPVPLHLRRIGLTVSAPAGVLRLPSAPEQ